MQEHNVEIGIDEKIIYYILDIKGNVLDFTEEKTDNVYGSIPVDMSLMEFKKIIEFDKRLFTYENNTLTSKPRLTDLEKIQQDFNVFKKQINEEMLQLRQRISLLENQSNINHEIDIEIEE